MKRRFLRAFLNSFVLSVAIFTLTGCGGGGESNGNISKEENNNEALFPPKSSNGDQMLWGSMKWGSDCWKDCSQ